MQRSRTALRMAFAFAVLCLPLSAPTEALTLNIDGDSVTVGEATAGGSVALIGAGRELVETVPHLFRSCEMVTAGPDGVAVLTLSQPAPANFLWLALDLATGTVGIANSRQNDLTTFPPALLNKAPNGAVTDLILDYAGYFQFLAARPGAGAWCQTGIDGGANDADLAEDGQLKFAVSALAPAGATSTQIADLQEGDFIVLLDSETLELSHLELTAVHITTGIGNF